MPVLARGVVLAGQVRLAEPLNLIDGTEVLIAVPDAQGPETSIWRLASDESHMRAWDSPEDDVYDELSKG